MTHHLSSRKSSVAHGLLGGVLGIFLLLPVQSSAESIPHLHRPAQLLDAASKELIDIGATNRVDIDPYLEAINTHKRLKEALGMMQAERARALSMVQYIQERDLRREDTRELSKRIKGTEKKVKRFVYNYRPKGSDYRLRLEFKKQEITRDEIIHVLEEILKNLKSKE